MSSSYKKLHPRSLWPRPYKTERRQTLLSDTFRQRHRCSRSITFAFNQPLTSHRPELRTNPMDFARGCYRQFPANGKYLGYQKINEIAEVTKA